MSFISELRQKCKSSVRAKLFRSRWVPLFPIFVNILESNYGVFRSLLRSKALNAAVLGVLPKIWNLSQLHTVFRNGINFEIQGISAIIWKAGFRIICIFKIVVFYHSYFGRLKNCVHLPRDLRDRNHFELFPTVPSLFWFDQRNTRRFDGAT